jgi:hypothetical protein
MTPKAEKVIMGCAIIGCAKESVGGAPVEVYGPVQGPGWLSVT